MYSPVPSRSGHTRASWARFQPQIGTQPNQVQEHPKAFDAERTGVPNRLLPRPYSRVLQLRFEISSNENAKLSYARLPRERTQNVRQPLSAEDGPLLSHSQVTHPCGRYCRPKWDRSRECLGRVVFLGSSLA